MNEKAHILVIDDDVRLLDLLRKYLCDHGYGVTTAADALEARRKLDSMIFDLIVVDGMMPGEDGFDLTRSLRKNSAIPILFLTAMGEVEDRIKGLECGADDYLTKPFEPRELLLRIANILRRAPRQDDNAAECVRFGPFFYDAIRAVLSRETEIVHLTTAETQLLAILAQSPNQTIDREELAQRTGCAGNPRAVDVQMTRLRRKIEEDPRFPLYLQTIRGLGYMLRCD